MGATSSLSTAGSALRRNPIIFVAMVIAAVVGLLSAAVQFLVGTNDPVVGSLLGSGVTLVVTVFVNPFIEGGIIGMAREGIAGRTSFGTFLGEGRRNYLGLLLANIAYFLVFFVIGLLYVIIILVATFVVGVSGSASGGTAVTSPGLGVGLGAVVVSLLLLLVALLVPFFLQFYKAAVVVSDTGVTDSFRRSAGLVRGNILSTLWYNVLSILIGVISAIPTLYYVLTQISLSNPGATSETAGFLGTSASGGIVFVVASAVLSLFLGAFLRTYYVAYYTDRTGDQPESTP